MNWCRTNVEKHPWTIRSCGLPVSEVRPLHHMEMQSTVFTTDFAVKFDSKSKLNSSRQTSADILTVVRSLSHIMHICAYGTLYLPPPPLEDTKFTITCQSAKVKSSGETRSSNMVLFFFQFGTLTPGRNFILLEGIHIFKLSIESARITSS